MNCPHCGAPVVSGNRFCQRCRQRIAPDPGGGVGSAPSPAPVAAQSAAGRFPPRPARAPAAAASGRFTRPLLVTLLAALDIAGGALVLAMAALVVFAASSSSRAEPGAVIVGLSLGLVGLLQAVAGVGLLRLASWGRGLQMGLAFLGLLGIPCGTLVSVLVLVYLFKPEVKLLFSGASPADLAPEEQEMVRRLSESSSVAVVAVLAVVLLLGVAGIGIVAAIAIPSLLRARVSANEAATIGDLRTLVSAQAAYASANGGHYDQLSCLQRPSGCIPGYPASGPRFLDEAFATSPRHGYEFRLEPGDSAAPEVLQRGAVSPSSLSGFAYVAVPVKAGQTGVRAFCADASGLVCYVADGGAPAVTGGVCPSACRPF